MSVSSPCEVCGRADVEAACDRCGQLVCGRHFDDDHSLCTECAARHDDGVPEHIPGGEDMPDGVGTYRF